MFVFVSVAINQIKEIRPGKTTDVLRNRDVAGHYPDECAFSITVCNLLLLKVKFSIYVAIFQGVCFPAAKIHLIQCSK